MSRTAAGMSFKDRETLDWIKKNKTIRHLRHALTREGYDKLFSDFPSFLIWLWGEEWYEKTKQGETKEE